MRHSIGSVSLAAMFCAALAGCASAPPQQSSTPPPVQPPAQLADLAIIGANIVTMDATAPRAQAVAVSNGRIVKIGDDAQIRPLIGKGTKVIEAAGATVLPGFIDGHSHTAGYSFFNDPDNWVDVSSINMFFKPHPGDARCKTPDNPQYCFIPVRHHDDVIARLKKRLAQIEAGTSTQQIVLAFNYDPARLGHNPGCKKGGVGFQCRSFEDGRAREQLDALSKTVPIYVASESGHLSYVNTPALKLLNICNVLPGSTAPCYTPSINPDEETKLARLGQLDEDLSLYGTGYFQGKYIIKENKGLYAQLLRAGALIYANHGFTLVQEGAAGLALAGMYVETMKQSTDADPFPVAVALVMYDEADAGFSKTLEDGLAARALIGDKNPLLSVEALKSFADGSPQGFTANLTKQYLTLHPPFTDPKIFKQPYTGLPDVNGKHLHERLDAAHKAGFPMVIHQNGDESITEAVDAILLASKPPAGKRDLVLHAPMITSEQMARLAKRGDTVVSFLVQNVYFWGLPECHQVLGRDRVVNMYPLREAKRVGLPTTLHSDSPVTTPYPLFEAWVAKTRRAQAMPWYAPHVKDCPLVLSDPSLPPGDQSVSIADSLRALTVDAAYQYGMENIRGSLAAGKYADMVMLSADPLAMEDDPDQLKTVRVLRTVRYGTVIENANAHEPPIWPGD